MGTAKNHFVANPINRYSVSDRSGLAQNSDGSVDLSVCPDRLIPCRSAPNGYITSVARDIAWASRNIAWVTCDITTRDLFFHRSAPACMR
jgi:hypothetical protein